MQKHNETRWSKHGVSIIDDTLIEKVGKKILFAGKFYDHAKERFVHAINLVTLHYVDCKTEYPVNFSIYRKAESVDEV